MEPLDCKHTIMRFMRLRSFDDDYRQLEIKLINYHICVFGS